MKSLKNAGIHPGLLGLVEIDLTDLIPREVSPHAQTWASLTVAVQG